MGRMTFHRFVVLFLVILLFASSCLKEKKYVGERTAFDPGDYAIVCNPRLSYTGDGAVKDTEFTLISYFGPRGCSVCALKMMSIWDDIADILGRDNITYRFLFSDNDGTPIELFEKVLAQYYFSFPVYVDTCGSFVHDNPFIAEEDKPVSLLLDRSGVVLDSGRPEVNDDDLKRFVEEVN